LKNTENFGVETTASSCLLIWTL